MSLELVEDDRVLEAALSLLDHQSDNDEGPAQAQASGCSSPCNKKRKTRSCNPNRAREAQTKELLDLRAQVPRLEKSLEALQQKLTMAREDTDMMELWKKLALHERQTRKRATEENRRLRALVREANETSTRTMQTLLQTRPDHVQTSGPLSTVPDPEPGPSRRLYALPVDSSDVAVFREMADSMDTAHRQVLQVYSMGGDVEAASFPSEDKANCRAFADKILPFDVEAVSDAAWQFFAHSFRRPTTRFYYHTESFQPAEFVSDDTVIEVFGEEHRFGQVLLDVKVKQIIRRYVAVGRVVIAWRAILSPQKFKTETLRDVAYEEDGALVIESRSPGDSTDETSSVVHTWQKVTPKLSGFQSELVQELTEFVLTSCKPGRAIQSMERTLRGQPASC